jgi:uncharacterized protein
MRIETRNLLAAAILGALDDPEAAVALRCLAAYCNTTGVPPTAVPIETLCSALPDKQSAGVIGGLQRSPLLLWEIRHGKEFASLALPLTENYSPVVVKLLQYETALTVWTPDESGDGRTVALAKAVCLFNHHLFFEVHEILEEQWKQEEGAERLFLQGLIQIAVAFHHLHNNNFRGATALLHDGVAKIAPHQPEFLDIEVQRFVGRIIACQQELQRLGPEHFQQFPLEMIPSLQFVA